MKAGKLLPAVAQALIKEQSESLLCLRRQSGAWVWGEAKAMPPDFMLPVYRLPDATVGVAVLDTREVDATAATQLAWLPCTGADSTKVSTDHVPASMLPILARMERQEGGPLSVVVGVGQAGEKKVLFPIDTQPLLLPPLAHVRAAASMLQGATPAQAVRILRRTPDQELPRAKFSNPGKPIVSGLPAFPGVVTGQVADFFIKSTTSPADIAQMKQAKAILTGGGWLCHAAILAASEEIPCIVGLTPQQLATVSNQAGMLSVDATQGRVYAGELLIVDDADSELAYAQIGKVVRDLVPDRVMANADTPTAIQHAIQGGAAGIGLYRTEHSYREGTGALQDYIAAVAQDSAPQRRKCLFALRNLTLKLFSEAFEAVGEHKLIIRLLDAPMSEFSAAAAETNPMMGLRGSRFGIQFADFYAMQVQTIAEAWVATKQAALPGIMVPLVSEVGEVIVLRDLVSRVWGRVAGKAPCKFGAMIETPRACLVSGEIAQLCDFLSYGTNDLTQFTYAFSRDDATFLPNYTELGVLDRNPFQTLDPRGVGRLLDLSVVLARSANPKIRLGLCGQHGGDPDSIKLVFAMGMDYVSCTVGRLPVALRAALEVQA